MQCQKSSNMKDLYIIGAGGFGREVAWLVERINQINPTWNLKGFIDDNESRWGSKEGNYPVYGGGEYLKAQGVVYVVCAIFGRMTAGRKKEPSEVSYAEYINSFYGQQVC